MLEEEENEKEGGSEGERDDNVAENLGCNIAKQHKGEGEE